MSVEELLKPRYKVIADWPNSGRSVGDLIIDSPAENLPYQWCKENADKYPHLFKKLDHWADDRKKEDMPTFVKWINPATKGVHFFKVEQWLSNSVGVYVAHVLDPAGHFYIKDLHPATEQEYQSFISRGS